MTGEGKFTKGPWKYTPNGEGWLVTREDVFVVGHGICGVRPSQSADEDQCEANAALIAAAPTMYEALDNLLRETELAGFSAAKDYGWPTVLPAARAALAKARGQS